MINDAKITNNNGKKPSLFSKIAVWFFSLLSIIFGVLALLTGPEACNFGWFAGASFAIGAFIAIINFLIALPIMIFLKIKRHYLTKFANISHTIILTINILVIGYIFLGYTIPAFVCPEDLGYYIMKDETSVLNIKTQVEKMHNIYERDGNYDNFEWENEEKRNSLYSFPRRVHSDDFQTACVYTPLDKNDLIPEKQHWYCADSAGNIGYTAIDPGTNGYCVPGEKSICPPVKNNPPLKILKDASFLFGN